MTAVITEATPAASARAVLERADSLTLTDGATPAVTAARETLRDAIGTHEGLLLDLMTGTGLHWDSYDPYLREYAEPAVVAVEKSGEECTDLSGLLAEVIAQHMGPEMAEYVSNGGN